MNSLVATLQRSEPSAGRIARDLLALIGGTPLIRLNRVTADLAPGVEILVKAEWFNPGGSIKDRPAFRMILDGIASRAFTPDRTLIDATSGNTGIGYAMIGAALGRRVTLCLPSNVSRDRIRTLENLGAELILTDPLEGTDGAIREAARRAAAEPERWFHPNQYDNPSNWRAHFETTGAEIWEQSEGRVTHFVAGLGTSGTFMGVGRRLRSFDPSVQLVAFQPDSPFHGLDGVKHMATAIVPAIYDPTLADENRAANTEEAYRMTRRLAREEGLLVGPSGGAAVNVALQVARTLGRGTVVTILPDGAPRYAGERFWNEDEDDPGASA